MAIPELEATQLAKSKDDAMILRELQLESSSPASSPEDIFLTIVGFGAFAFFCYCIFKIKRRSPPREILEEQRRRQRELIRRARLRNEDPESTAQSTTIYIDESVLDSRKIELTAAEATRRRSRLLQRFKSNEVRMVRVLSLPNECNSWMKICFEYCSSHN